MEHNVYYACGAEEALGDLARRGERAQLCYLDPPFWTGRDFGAYDDRFSSPNEYYDSMACILQGVKGAMDENGKWLPKSKNVYALDENGNRICTPSGSWKRVKVNTVDWNERRYGEIWRQDWAAAQNAALEAAGRMDHQRE